MIKRPKPRRQQVSKMTSLQAPCDGLNAVDSIANMKETEAPTMENWFPTPATVDIRNGSLDHVTGFSDPVETIAAYTTGTTSKAFAVAGGSVFDVTTAGTVGAAVVTGLSNARYQTVTMGTAGGYFLLMVNGANKMLRYTGSAWQQDGDGTADITGVNTANCIHINNFKNRVWLIEKDSFNAWYLAVSSIGGAAAKLDLSGLFKLGGSLMAMANWTIDNANGVDDYAVFVTSEGEVALYKGTDPSSSTTWALVGTFRMGHPIGRRCFCKAGSDVLLVTTDGAFPLSKALLTDRTQLQLAATDKIQRLINDDIVNYQSVYGWQPIVYPLGNKLIINVPTTETLDAHQYVMNTINGAWTKFTGWNAICWETMGDTLFFGTSDSVVIADVGTSDNGSNINAVCQQAFSYFGNKGQIKAFKMVRPMFLSEGIINPAVLMNVDFLQNRTTTSPSFSGTAGAEWDTSSWDSTSWGNENVLTRRWQSVSGVGTAGGIRVVTATNGIGCKWTATDVVYEVGGIL